jgi:hypothetical protein
MDQREKPPLRSKSASHPLQQGSTSPKKPDGTGRGSASSQVVDLLLHMLGVLGITDDQEIADLVGVTREQVKNWKKGVGESLKLVTLDGVKRGLAAHLRAILDQTYLADPSGSTVRIDVEDGAGPSELLRQFGEKYHHDSYLGHRFLYYDPHCALAWENLIRRGYGQEEWLRGVERCAEKWLGHLRDGQGLDVVSLGPGEGEKEYRILQQIALREQQMHRPLGWLTYMPVDLSMPLLLRAARRALSEPNLWRSRVSGMRTVVPICADFEYGRLDFVSRLPSEQRTDGHRLVLVLGNILGNVQSEDTFIRRTIHKLTRPGDLVWIEVARRLDPIESDPVFPMTVQKNERTAEQSTRTALLEMPYRVWEVSQGRLPREVTLRVTLQSYEGGDDSCKVPGSVNFCHDLVIEEEKMQQRIRTMLFTRRYRDEQLNAIFTQLGLEPEDVVHVKDSKSRPLIAHYLLRRR